MKTLALLLLLAPLLAPAATTLGVNCTNGSSVFKTIALNTTVPFEVSAVSTGTGLTCQLLNSTPATWYVRITTNGGATYSLVTLASQGFGAAAAPPPPPVVKVQMLITWGAVTSDASGVPLNIPVTYNLYRGASATSLTKLVTAATSPYTDTTVTSGTSYCYGVSAVDANGESTIAAGPCLLATPTQVPAAPVGVAVKVQ